MRTSQYFLSTLREIPSDAEIVSHQLMLRAGMIRKLASGIYIWLPTGLRVLRKIEGIVREEMNNAGALEISMPIIQPAYLWQESGRWTQYGRELLRFEDRSTRQFVVGPTHEEVITHLLRNEVNSYKQLPLNLFQIKTKFRDEIRPRFGVIRSREFIMKDAYSFHTSNESLQNTYDIMYQTYSTILTRIGLDFCAVEADTGTIGGHASHEFHIIAASGEDEIVFSTNSNYAKNIELAEAIAPSDSRSPPCEELRLVDRPDIHHLTELMKIFNLPVEKTIKVLIVRGCKKGKEAINPLVALIIRGDHQLSKVKAEHLSQVASPLIFASKEEISLFINADHRSLGPINLPIPMVIDRSVAVMSDFAACANVDGKYFLGINWERDLPLPEVADLRKMIACDISPERRGLLQIKRGIEVGHIFKLGNKYSKAMKATIQDEYGRTTILKMGCYGMGISRVVAATIEQNHDERGILWPELLSPFNIAILPIDLHNSFRVQDVAKKIYSELCASGIDVLLDDRKENPGVMFKDMELIGIPHTIVIGDRNLEREEIEYKNRRSGKNQLIKLSEVIDFLIKTVKVGIQPSVVN